jgi:hypothetical protein
MTDALRQSFIAPDWPAPLNVCAIQTTRMGGVSLAPFNSLNVGDHVNDNALHVAQNRQLLAPYVPTEPVWMNQVHGIRVLDAAKSSCIESADAAFTNQNNVVCVAMTADCLPVLICDQQGTTVAAVHAGWRSLCNGVLEATVKAISKKPDQLMAWLGPAIGPDAFEVGAEVREQFIEKDAEAISAFKVHGERYLGDLYTIAKQRLNQIGVTQVYGGGLCTYKDTSKFFSYRRDGLTGRMATLIWLK